MPKVVSVESGDVGCGREGLEMGWKVGKGCGSGRGVVSHLVGDGSAHVSSV